MSRSKDDLKMIVGDLYSEILFYGIGMYAMHVWVKRMSRYWRRKLNTPDYNIPEWFFTTRKPRTSKWLLLFLSMVAIAITIFWSVTLVYGVEAGKTVYKIILFTAFGITIYFTYRMPIKTKDKRGDV